VCCPAESPADLYNDVSSGDEPLWGHSWHDKRPTEM